MKELEKIKEKDILNSVLLMAAIQMGARLMKFLDKDEAGFTRKIRYFSFSIYGKNISWHLRLKPLTEKQATDLVKALKNLT